MSAKSNATLPLLRRLWRTEVCHRKATLFYIALLSLLGAGTMALYPIIIKYAIDMFVSKDISVLSEVVIVILCATSFKALFQFLQTWSIQSTSLSIIGSLQSKMLTRLLNVDLTYLESETPSTWSSRFMFDATAIREFLNKSLNAFSDLATVIALACSMIWIDWQLSLFALVLYPLASIPIKRLGNKGRKASKEMHEAAAFSSSRLNEVFAQGIAIRSYGLQEQEEKRVGAILKTMLKAMEKMARLRAMIDPLLEVISGIAIAFVFYFLAWRMSHNGAGLGDLTGFITALFAASRPMRSLGSLNSATQEGMAGLEKVFSIIDIKDEIIDPKDPIPFPPMAVIRGDNVSYVQPNGHDGLKGVNFEFKAGRFSALTGPSGAGKSTLLKLIPRLFEATSGNITFSGTDIKKLKLTSIRSRVGYVSQNMPLFENTILENIRMGKPDASNGEIIALCNSLGIDFIHKLPNGLKTQVGRDGCALSGGERQRIVLARAMISDFDILLLDEPTSALDAENEVMIFNKILEVRKGKTTIIVTHKLQLLEDATEIFVMEDGHIVQVGDHHSLAGQSGVYANLLAVSS